LKGVKGSESEVGVERILVRVDEASDGEEGWDDELGSEDWGAASLVVEVGWSRRMAFGSTDTMSPGAKRVFAFWCFLPLSNTSP